MQSLEDNTAQTESGGQAVWYYMSDLAKQLSVIGPAGPDFRWMEKLPGPT